MWQTDRLASNTMWLKAACCLYKRSATVCHKFWQLCLSRPVVAHHIITSVCALCCANPSICWPLFLSIGNVSDPSFSSVRPRISLPHFLLHNMLSVILCLKKCMFKVSTLPKCCTACFGSYRRFESTDISQIQGSRSPRRMSGNGGSVIRIEGTVIGWQGM
jgi:hypothetical protein